MLGRIVSNGIALGRRAGSITASNSDSSFDDDSEAGAPINGTPIKFSPSSKGSVSSSENHRSVTSSETRTHDIGQPRSFAERSATRGMATSTSESLNSSQGAPPPTLTLAAYPGPGSTQQRSSSTSSLLPSPIVTGTTQFSGTPPRDGRGSIPGTTTQSFITAMQAMTFNPTEGNLLPAHQNLRDQTCRLQSRIWGLRQGMYGQSGIPPEFLTSFDYDIQELVANTVKVNKAADNLGFELKEALDECESLKARIRKLELDAKSWKGHREELEIERSRLLARSTEDMKTMKLLSDQLRQTEMAKMILQDQVEGKRSLWLEVHRDPQEQAAAMRNLNRNSTPVGVPPFAKPMTQNQFHGMKMADAARINGVRSGSLHTGVHSGNANTGGYHPGGHLQAQAMPRSYSSSGPIVPMGQFQHQPRLSTATSSSARSSVGNRSSTYLGTTPIHVSSVPRRSPRAPGSTEWGSPNERKRVSTGLLTKVGLNDGECKKWAEEFQGLFALVGGFCESYFNVLPHIDGDWKSHIQAQANGVLWDYICQVCQPGQEHERADRAMGLLMDDVCRPYLMQRLIVQHIIVFIFTYEGWRDYSEDGDEEMAKLEKNLKNIDPRKTYERQAIIDRRAELVTEMASGANAAAFKNHKLNQHHQHLKTMVAPFLPRDKKSTTTQEAFYDLFTIAGSAWELSTKLFQSRLTFQYVWNDVHTRFSAETHRSLGIDLDPHMLQQEYWRIKLCVTPAITLRNDQGMTIDTKNILKSGVLVMRY